MAQQISNRSDFHRKLRIALGISGLLLPLIAAMVIGASTGEWQYAGDMNVPRTCHTASTLHDGQILIVGGFYGHPLASAELYDPATGVFTFTGNLNMARTDHAAVVMADGRVLVVGGDSSTAGHSVEIYDPSTGTFTVANDMHEGRWLPTATLLNDGSVLVVGGSNGGSTAELYDPTTGLWSYTGAPNTPRIWHTATLLPDGRVLIAGGSPLIADAELYDPTTGTFIVTNSMNVARFHHRATLLSDGRVLITGGTYDPTDYSTEIFDPTTETWSFTGDMIVERSYEHSAILLPDTRILVAGGAPYPPVNPTANATLNEAEIFDPATGLWESTGNLNEDRRNHVAALLSDGQVLVMGGIQMIDDLHSITLSSAEIYSYTNILYAGDLALKKSVSPAAPTAPGAPVTYTLTFSYTGPNPATAVTLTDRLPTSLTNIHVISSGIAITQVDSAPYTWVVPEMASGQSGILTITGQLSDTLPASLITNRASITGMINDVTPSNNEAAAYLAVNGTPQVVTLAGPFTPGQTYTFSNGVCGSVTFTSATQVPASLTITYTENYPTHNGDGLPRRYDITAPGGHNYEAQLTLCYEDGELVIGGIDPADESYLHLYRYQGNDAWESYSEVDPIANTVTAHNVTEFGVWGFGVSGNPGPDDYPTAARLRDIEAWGVEYVPVVLAVMLVGCLVIAGRHRR